MNKTAIKNFAIWARNKLIADISYRAGLMGITADGIHPALPQSTGQTKFYDIGTVEPYAISGEAIHQREHLADLIRRKAKDSNYQTAYKYIIEEVAYTWFNRLIAVRFMEVNDYLPSHIRVLSSDQGKLEPDLVTTPFDADLDFTRDEQQAIMDFKSENKLDELFRLLFIKQCNALNEILPALFEKTNDYTELLLNLSVIDQDGVVYHLVHDIPEEDFDIERGGQVEIIGWLYQYYNTEPKNAAFAKKGKITKEEIPAVTQLFTPDWIVRYMVENSLGRLWIEHLLACGDSRTEAEIATDFGWKYYLPEAEQEPEVAAQLSKIREERRNLTPEKIRCIDPCMGSGHICVYLFSVLMQIYESVGYGQRDAAKSILENNIYGLDIDDRAFQMAYFAVMMKAREYNRRILNGEDKPNLYSILESNGIERTQLQLLGKSMRTSERSKALRDMNELLDTFMDAKEYGAILTVREYDWDRLEQFVNDKESHRQISMSSMELEETSLRLWKIIRQGRCMAQKYDVVCTNPPYMGNMPDRMTNYVQNNFAVEKYDLYAVFVKRCREFIIKNGYISMITQQAWLFLSSFERFRNDLLLSSIIVNLLQLGAHAFDEIGGEVVQSVVFTIRNGKNSEFIGVYKEIQGESEKEKEKQFFIANSILHRQSDFNRIPGCVIAYQMNESSIELFCGEKLSDYVTIKSGIVTGNNDYFLKMWQELCLDEIGFDNKRFINNRSIHWVPMHKGGGYRKHYGLHDYVMNLHDIWEPGKTKSNVRRGDTQFYFRKGLTWSTLSNNLSIRQSPEGFVFDTKGSMCFCKNDEDLSYIEAFLNSKVAAYYMSFLSPTLDFNQGAMGKIPFILEKRVKSLVDDKSQKCVDISKLDWDSFETSWDFKQHPLVELRYGNSRIDTRHYRNKSGLIKDAFDRWKDQCQYRFDIIKQNEEELNRVFIEIYSLQDVLSPEVENKDVTIRMSCLQRDIKSLLSYAIGCMFGRYSLDIEGIAYAGGEWDSSKYTSFIPDADNVIPITDEEYLEDDVIARLCEWLKAAYGVETMEENLDFIAKALGNKGNSSREIIRNYFLTDFFKDHCQTYSVTGSGKRPIYWLFDSGKQNGFKALIYLHRYNADTIGNLRIDYLHRMQRIYESEIGRMQDMIDHSTSAREVGQATKRKDKLTKQLKECREYDEKLAHLALSRIELDLDDGVKVNYRKMQTANDGKLYEVLADSKNIMAKK